MQTLLSRILGNQVSWVREHRDAKVVEVRSVDGHRVTEFRDPRTGERAEIATDDLGNVEGVVIS